MDCSCKHIRTYARPFDKPKCEWTVVLLQFHGSEGINGVVEPVCHSGQAVIRKNKWEIDAVVCRGVSGMLVAPYLAAKLKLALVVVRKDEKRHSYRNVEGGWHDKFNYIIVDDLVGNGTTVKEILTKMRNDRSYAECKGLFLYSNAQGCGKDVIVERSGVQNVFFWYNADVGSTFDTTMPSKISKKSVDSLTASDTFGV